MSDNLPAQSLYLGINLIMMIETLMSDETERQGSQFIQITRLLQAVYQEA